MNTHNIKTIAIVASAFLALAAGSITLPSIADAKGGGGFGMGGFGGGHFGGGIADNHFGGSVGGGRFKGSVGSRLGQLREGEGALGHSRFAHNDYDYGYYGYSCGPDQQAEGLCNPHYSY
jgi:hypothetical protein